MENHGVFDVLLVQIVQQRSQVLEFLGVLTRRFGNLTRA